MKSFRTSLPVCVALVLLWTALTARTYAAPLGTAFTYQGRLQDGTNAASGLYDLRFAVYDAASAGNQVGPVLTNNAVAVTNGLFTVTLDFGANVFDGNARWLETAVRTNGVGDFGLLPPRQPLTPAPYALYAPNAGIAQGVAPGSVTSAALAPSAVMLDKIGAGQIIKSLNGLVDDVALAPGTNVTFTTRANTIIISAAGGGTNIVINTNGPGSGWSLTGNAGTTPGVNFVGTTDNQPLELSVNGWRALRLEPTTLDSAPNIIAGYGGRGGNFVAAGVTGATIGGGGAMPFSTPGGLTIYNNNHVGGDYGVIAGGMQNVVNGPGGVVSGGQANIVQAQGMFAVVPGGDQNLANGTNSLAAGHRAKATHDGSFVWADVTEADFSSTSANQFLVRAGGGVGINKNNPAAALDVNGLVRASGFQGVSSGALEARLTSTAAGAGDWSWGTGWIGAGRPNFYLYDYGASATRLLVDASGNVGIGTNNPQSALHVAGAVTARAFGGNWQVVANDVTTQPNCAYLVNSPNQVTLTLPASPAVGDTLRVSGAGAGGWKLAQNAGQRVQTRNLGVNGLTSVWTARESDRRWNSVASSADGTKLVAAVFSGQIYTSTDSGVSWTAHGSNQPWASVASSADGTKLVAVGGGTPIYTSTDSGVSWTVRESNQSWASVASSADGTALVVVARDGQIYTSTDSGVNWTAHGSNRNWSSVASSADGTKLVAVGGGTPIYTSTDSGVSWTVRESNRSWISVASSADGSKLVALDFLGQIYTSTDSGVSWTTRESSRVWASVASSADGAKLVAVVLDGQIYTSTDSGVSWTARESNRNWSSVASSADGTKLVAGVDGGQIYTATAATTTGTGGNVTGDHYSALELQYIGNGDFMPLSYVGNLLPY